MQGYYYRSACWQQHDNAGSKQPEGEKGHPAQNDSPKNLHQNFECFIAELLEFGASRRRRYHFLAFSPSLDPSGHLMHSLIFVRGNGFHQGHHLAL